MNEISLEPVAELSLTNIERNLWDTMPPSLISAKVWLPINVNVESVNRVLKNLTLSDIMIALPFDSVNKNTYKLYGLICPSRVDLISGLTNSGPIRHNLYSKKIANSELTVDLLNMRICTKIDSKSTTVMENYLSSLFGSNSDTELTSHLKASIPIAFAHNLVARQLATSIDDLIQNAENTTERDHIYSFISLPINNFSDSAIQSKDAETAKKFDFVYVNESGDLMKLKEGTTKSVDNFVAILRSLGATDVIAVVANPLGELRHEMEVEKQALAEIDPDRSNFIFADESLTEEDLNEMSTLSEEIDDAEDFALCIQGVNESTTLMEPNENAKSTKEIRKAEKRIRELAKRIAATRKQLIEQRSNAPHSATPNDLEPSDRDLYSSKDYAQFSEFYRLNALENTLTTPKSSVRSKSRVNSACENAENAKRQEKATPQRISTRLSSATNTILRDCNQSAGLTTKSKTSTIKKARRLDVDENARSSKKKC